MNFSLRRKTRSLSTSQGDLVSESNRRLKMIYFRKGIRCCEICGWSAPPAIIQAVPLPCLILHHIMPLAFGGPLGDIKNTMLLCRNHAGLGDALAAQAVTVYGEYVGPRTRDALFALMQTVEQRAPWVSVSAPKAMEGLNAD